MIEIGLAGWGDHEKLYKDAGPAAKNKLPVYASWFNTVEVDSTFYAVQSPSLLQRWAGETPESFRFVIKAYQGMTGHMRGGGHKPFESQETMFQAFRESIEPIREAGKLDAVLFQYPPWFDCNRLNVAELRRAKEWMGDIPCALEFRHQSWFSGAMREKTLDFTAQEGWIHTVCDEPQVGDGSVPIVEAAVDPRLTIVRLHGRNKDGWLSSGQPNWREVRYLYRYNEEELREWAERLHRLAENCAKVCILFNNNSGGDAADNALQLMAMLGQTPPRGSFDTAPAGEPVEQLDLFDLTDGE